MEGFARLFEERHYPLYAPFFEFYLTEEDEPPFTVLRNVPAVERDLYWEPKTIGAIRRQSR